MGSAFFFYIHRLDRTPTKFKMCDDTFEGADAGASKTIPMQCSALRKNGFVVIKNRPCKIVEMSTSKTGKHGHAKVHMVGIDLFTGKKYEDICPSTHNMNVPHVQRKDYTLMDMDRDKFLTILGDDCIERNDLKLPDGDLGQQIQTALEKGENPLVTVLCAMDEECVIAFKPDKS